MNEHVGAESVKILIVDDKVENLIALEKTLAPLKLQIIKATSGNEALKLMLNHEFCVVLLDVMMPVMDGFEVAKLMHQHDSTKHVPIIFLTALNKSDESYMQAMEAGAIDYINKPIDPVILLCKVRVFVDLFLIKNKLQETIKTLNQYQDELQKTNDKLKHFSEEDSLTKLANRRHFENEFVRFIDIAKRSEKSALALFFFDVDDFKEINDKYGHASGDLVLKTVSENILKIMKMLSSTKVSYVVARVGGDEFAIVFVDEKNNNGNDELIAKQLLKEIETPIQCGENKVSISVSIGIARYPTDGTNVEELLHAADIALYNAKETGKSCYVFYQDVAKIHHD